MNSFYAKELSRGGNYLSTFPLSLSQVAILSNTGDEIKLLSNDFRFIISTGYNHFHPFISLLIIGF